MQLKETLSLEPRLFLYGASCCEQCVQLSALYGLHPKYSVVPGWEESHNNKEGLGERLSSNQRLYVARKEREEGGKGKKEGRDKVKEGIANA